MPAMDDVIKKDGARVFHPPMSGKGRGLDKQYSEFNGLAIDQLNAGSAKCTECGETITNWVTYYSPSEGSFPEYECVCFHGLKPYFAPEYWAWRERRKKNDKMITDLFSALALAGILIALAWNALAG